MRGAGRVWQCGGVAGAQTRATAALAKAGARFAVHEYDRPPAHTPGGYGGEAVAALADRLGVQPGQILKTLVVRSGALFAVAVVPVPATLSLKAAAAALGLGKAEMAPAEEAERATGYVVGGISPLGLRRALPVVVDESVLRWDRVLCSAGRRGLEIDLHPRDLVRLAGARTAPIAR